MLRKAEAVIQWRTSRLVIVIERCTNGMQTGVKIIVVQKQFRTPEVD